MKKIYLLLCIVGVLLPFATFFPWLSAHGLAFHLLAQQAFSEPVSAFAWVDVLVSAVALLTFMLHQQRVRPVKGLWMAVAGLFCVGVSFALPLYLYLRERSEVT
ncbi:MAG: DUF2834 domain-containing protein [Pseudomonadota bacterium]